MITVLIADDHPVIRFAVGMKLAQEPEVTVVAETGDLPATFAAVEEHRPDELLLDLHLPEPVLPALPSLREAAPDTAILVLTGRSVHGIVHRRCRFPRHCSSLPRRCRSRCRAPR